MAVNQGQTEVSGVIVWAEARKFLAELTAREFRLAAKASSEFKRGEHAGRGSMCEELQNLPEALAILRAEDEDARKRLQG